MITFTGKYTTANVMIDNVDAETQSQIVEFINHPFFAEQVVVMPDCHAGKGAVVGFTMPLPKSGKIIPAIVGVDINCGMLMLPLFEKNIPVTREELDQLIRRVVPTDTDVHDGSRGHLPQFSMERHFHWSTVNQLNKRFCMAYERHFGRQMYHTHYDYEWFLKKCAQIGMDSLRAERSIGTLGGGNHFLEFGRSVINNKLYLTIHTGSRQFGKCIGEYWQKLPVANKYKDVEKEFQKSLDKIKAEAHTKELRKEIPNKIRQLKAKLGMNNKALKAKDLDYIEGEDAQGYLTDMLFAAVYASINRIEIATSISSLGIMMDFDHAIESVHNFIDYDDFVIRKGAIRAYNGEKMIIPFNMEDGILVCEGKSNPEWNFSAPHGAGRVLSRGQAKRVLGDSLVAAKRMKNKGIYASIIPVDETKESYKDPAVIERHIEPTATIIDRIKPILTIKGGKID